MSNNVRDVLLAVIALLTTIFGAYSAYQQQQNSVAIHNNHVDASEERKDTLKKVEDVDKTIKEVKKQNVMMMRMKGIEDQTEKDKEAQLKKGPIDFGGIDLEKEHLGPVVVWSALSERGKNFLGTDSKSVDPRESVDLENSAKAKGLGIKVR